MDCEGDSLTPTKLHCLVAQKVGTNKLHTTTNYDQMRKLFENAEVIIGHNIIRWDIPQIERLLGIKIKARLIDTLGLSWYLEPMRPKHGLEDYGVQFGVPKPLIKDWENLTLKEYCHRCEEDVRINVRLWRYQWRRLKSVYSSESEISRFLDYLMFKLDCAREQEQSRWKLDIQLCTETVNQLEAEQINRVEELAKAMPKVPVKAKKTAPKVIYRKDGTPSVHGNTWLELLKHKGLPADYDGEVEVIVEYNDPNPNSTEQVKNWLYSFGWKPQTFKYQRDKDTGDIRKIPQLRDDKTGNICESIVALYDKEPALQVLEGLSILKHRIPMLKGFLKAMSEDGYVYAGVQGLTNTLRFKHAVAVNLPKPNKPYGEQIRGSLIAREGNILCGSDMSSLEDRIKQHFLYEYDPEYVESLNTKGYDPHLSIAVLAKMVTEEEVTFYKYYKGLSEEELLKVNDPVGMKADWKRLDTIRGKAKNANYACQYGAGVSRIALTAAIPESEAALLHQAYWKMNWAIKAVAKAQVTKEVEGQMWLLNPINGFWYTLRFEKDIFSTLVQGTASYVFDLWVMRFREERPQLTAQFHDEVVLELREGREEHIEDLLKRAIRRVNDELKLNRELGVDIQFGKRYSDIH